MILQRLASLSLSASLLCAQPLDLLRVEKPEPLAGLNLTRISEQSLRAHLDYLAAPERQGRGLGTKGIEAAAAYIEQSLKASGLQPFSQKVPLRRVENLKGTLELRFRGKRLSWIHGKDALFGELNPDQLAAQAVFAGYGISEPSSGHDDFAGLDVKGKVVFFRAGMPESLRKAHPELVSRYDSSKLNDRYEARIAKLDRLGAVGAVALEESLEAAPPQKVYYRSISEGKATQEPFLIRAQWKAAMERLPALVTLRLWVNAQVKQVSSRNVLAVVKGRSDGGEAVLMGAHYDHLGMPGGVVHPGADDNASGVSALLEIAHLMASATPSRRTVIFAFWTGEEDGKFGSGHYVRHPHWPLARTRAYVNLDMIGHAWMQADLKALAEEGQQTLESPFFKGLDPRHFAELGYSDDAPWMREVLLGAGSASGMSLRLDPGNGRWGGSDYRDFAWASVPWVRFFGSFFPDYHQPGDRPEALDANQVQRMARLACATGWLLAER